MRYFVRQILQDVRRGENLDLLVTVVLVLVISILDGLGVASASLVSSITLATLGLIAVGLLVTRYRLEDIHREKDVTNLAHLQMRRTPALTGDLAAAKEIWMMGITLRGTTTGNFYDFKRKAEQGGSFRALVVDVDEIKMDKVLRQFSRGGSEEQFRAEFNQTLNQYREIRQAALHSENVQLRLIDFVPPFRLYVFPEAGALYVEIYSYQAPFGAVPKFRITEHEQPDWYAYFASQFEAMWQDARVADLGLNRTQKSTD